jgi:uncharacterized protein (TIGR03437 family)
MSFGRREAISGCGKAAIFLIAALPALLYAADPYPAYSTDSIVNAATQTVESLAPNTIATMYGTNLAFSTSSATGTAVGATLPSQLGGVTVYVNGLIAHLFFVSPTQINFLIPYELTPGIVTVTVARQGAAGPTVKVQLNSTSPGLFPWNGNNAIATHLSGALITATAPAAAGEIIVIYAAGLGRVSPDTTSGRLVTSAATIVAGPQTQVTLAGVAVPSANILYAGLAPGFAGLYQINLRVPDLLPANPEIRIVAAGQTSPALIVLPAVGNSPVLPPVP